MASGLLASTNMAENYNFRFTICVIGGRRVGKTQIITRYTEDRYTGEDTFYSYLRSVSRTKIRTISLNEKTICLIVREFENRYYGPGHTPRDGNPEYRAEGFMLLYDITNEDSFNEAESYLTNIESNTYRDVAIILAGNKCDLIEKREVDSKTAENFAEYHGITCIETSAKDGTNIDEAFELLVQKLLAPYTPVQKDNLDLAKGKDDFRSPSDIIKKEMEKKLRQNLNKAKKQHGTIPVRFLKLFFTGSGAAGKTSFINLLMKRKINKYHHSTNVVHTSHAVSVKKAVFQGSSSEIRWIEFDTELEISHLRSILLPEPVEKEFYNLRETVSPPSKSTTAVHHYRPPPKPHQSAVKHFLGGFFAKTIKDANLSTFDNIIDATETKPIVHQPGELLNIITLLDTGGQPEYIHLLPTINIHPTVTFVIHDISKSLSDQVLVEYSQHGKHMFTPYHLSYSNLDMIKLLMSAANDSVERPTSNILGLVTTLGTNTKSYICLVGTHADKVPTQVKMKVERELDSLVNLTHCETAVWQNASGKVLFSVDNTTAGSNDYEDPVANVIRSKIEKLAEHKDIYELPITWMLLELEIRHACSKREKAYISLQDCVTLARKTGLMSKVEKVKSVLLYHHLLGVLIYFEEVPGLCDYVIVDHQWWFDKLSNIICTTFQQASLDHLAVQKLKYQGLLSKELLQYVEWKDDIKEEFFLSLLARMRIIAPIFTEKKEIEEYFIPFLLPTCDLKQNNELLYQYGHLQGEPLLIHFQSGILPRGMFCSLIVELLQHSPEGWHPHFSHEGVHHTFSNLITFRLHEGYSLSLLDKVSYLEIQVRHPERDFCVSIHNGVYNYLVYALTEVCIHLNFNYERLQYGFVCQCGKGIDSHIAVVPDITSSMHYAECSLNSLHLVKLDSSHLIWVSLEQKKKDDAKPSNLSDWTIVDSLIEDNPDQPTFKRPAMRLLHDIVVPRIAADWSIVADYLEYEVEYKRIIKERCRDDPVKCCVELLEDWLSSDRGVSPKSWSRLIEALKGIKSLTDATEKIVQDLVKAGVVRLVTTE